MRGAMVDFVQMVCERLRLAVTTTHLSVYLLDRFMDAHHISDNQLRLTALTAVLLAAKFEEKDANVPRISELNLFANSCYSIGIFNSMEAFMLKFFNWHIGCVTAAHFAEHYLAYGVSPVDTIGGVPVTSIANARAILWRFTAQLLDVSLQDRVFLQWQCSQVAAACVACGRLYSHLLPTWPEHLQNISGYELSTLSQLMDLLLRIYESGVKGTLCNTPDSGHGSGHSNSLQSTPTSPATDASPESLASTPPVEALCSGYSLTDDSEQS
ncbi:cyclin-J-like [Oratosquilla oratoria]